MLKPDKAHVRSLKLFHNLAAICVHDGEEKFGFSLFDFQTGKSIRTIDNITSAVFNADGSRIIATNNLHDEHILVLNGQNAELLSSMTITFPGLHPDITVDKYRLFSIERIKDGSYLAFGAYYRKQDKFDKNEGKTMLFFLGNQIDEHTTF